jgi:hypothetical protein
MATTTPTQSYIGNQLYYTYPSSTTDTGTTSTTGRTVSSWTPSLPGYTSLADQASTVALSNLSGVLPSDVVSQEAQQAAERGVTTGSPGSEDATTSLLRALGLSSLDLTTLGEQQYNTLLSSAPRTTTQDTTGTQATSQTSDLSFDQASALNAILASQYGTEAGTAAGGTTTGGLTGTTATPARTTATATPAAAGTPTTGVPGQQIVAPTAPTSFYPTTSTAATGITNPFATGTTGTTGTTNAFGTGTSAADQNFYETMASILGYGTYDTSGTGDTYMGTEAGYYDQSIPTGATYDAATDQYTSQPSYYDTGATLDDWLASLEAP